MQQTALDASQAGVIGTGLDSDVGIFPAIGGTIASIFAAAAVFTLLNATTPATEGDDAARLGPSASATFFSAP